MEPSEYVTLFEHEDSFWWYRGLHRLVEAELRAALGRRSATTSPPDRSGGGRPLILLDAGCGTGGLLRKLARFGAWHGVDWSPHALSFARQRGKAPLARGSVERLPYRSDSLDVIVSLDVLYHREVEDDAAALREFHRCLRPGGLLVLNLPAYESLRSSHDEAIHTARRYRRSGLRRLLREAGLEPRRVTHWNTLLFPGLALVRWLRREHRPQRPGGPASDVGRLPGALNALLGGVLTLERGWLRRFDLPFGLSILAVAERPANGARNP